MQTACAFLNGAGGLVCIGVRPDATLAGQEVSDKTLREITQAAASIEPPASIDVVRVPVAGEREVLVLPVPGNSESVPFTHEGKPYQRSGSTTRRMPQQAYERLLLERMHSRRRWENQPADVTVRDIDRDEAFRLAENARGAGRFTGAPAGNLPDLLDRLGLRKGGEILRAAVVLFGKRFLPDYPQCELRMARFKGTDKAEFLDHRQVRGPAFRLLEEAELFCRRHFPLAARIVPGQMARVETPLIPPDAMREILVNALIHRDYSIAGGAVSLAIFDDRVEVWSAGTYPRGITPAALSRSHLSVLRNPLIADVFFRAGLIERWGRGTNRVIEMCRAADVAVPVFEEITGAAVVTFRVSVGVTTPQVTTQVTPQVTPQVVRLLEAARRSPLSRRELQQVLGVVDREHFRKAHIEPLITAGWLRRTIPDKPNSRLQRYRTTPAGEAALAGRS